MHVYVSDKPRATLKSWLGRASLSPLIRARRPKNERFLRMQRIVSAASALVR